MSLARQIDQFLGEIMQVAENKHEILLGECETGTDGGVYSMDVPNVTGRHAVYLKAESTAPEGWAKDSFKNRCLFELVSIVFMK